MHILKCTLLVYYIAQKANKQYKYIGSYCSEVLLVTVHTVAIMALEASPSEPSNHEMFSEKTFHTPNRLRKEPFNHKSDV